MPKSFVTASTAEHGSAECRYNLSNGLQGEPGSAREAGAFSPRITRVNARSG
jgi:hypothetical protein